MNYQTLVSIGGILFGLMLVSALLTRRGGVSTGNRLLAAALVAMMGYLLGIICLRQGWLSPGPLLLLPVGALLLSPAFLLGYVRSLLRPGFRLGRRHLWHLAPVAAFVILVLAPRETGVNAQQSLASAAGSWPPDSAALAGILFYILQAAYFTRAWRELQAHQHKVDEEFSYDEAVTLNWLRTLMGLSLLLAVTGLVLSLARLVPGIELWPRSLYSMTTVLVVYYLIGFMAIYQPAIFASGEAADRDGDSARDPGPVASDPATGAGTGDESSVLPEDVTGQYWQTLCAHMDAEAPYLNNKLRIADLARELDIPLHHLSHTINRRAGASFSDFINRYRVDRAIELLAEGRQSIVNVAFDAGFNSESAFYRHFKKVTGKTPREYQAAQAVHADPAQA